MFSKILQPTKRQQESDFGFGVFRKFDQQKVTRLKTKLLCAGGIFLSQKFVLERDIFFAKNLILKVEVPEKKSSRYFEVLSFKKRLGVVASLLESPSRARQKKKQQAGRE